MPEDKKKMYSCAGVSMYFSNGEYIIEELQEDGRQNIVNFTNPIIAVNNFSGLICNVLIKRMRPYLDKQGKNRYTGCDELEMSCHECQLSGNFADKNCQLEKKVNIIE